MFALNISTAWSRTFYIIFEQIVKNQSERRIYIVSINRKFHRSTKMIHILLLISIALKILPTSSFQIALYKTIVQSNKEWTRVKLEISGAEEPVVIQYDQCPQNWKQVLNYIYIPAYYLNFPNQYFCRFRVRDGSKLEMKYSVLFMVQNNKLKINDMLYAYDNRFDEVTGIFQIGTVDKLVDDMKMLLNQSFDGQANTNQTIITNSQNSTNESANINLNKNITSKAISKNNMSLSERLKQDIAKKISQSIGKALSELKIKQKLNSTNNSKQKGITNDLNDQINIGDWQSALKLLSKVVQSSLSCGQKSNILSVSLAKIQAILMIKQAYQSQLRTKLKNLANDSESKNSELQKKRQQLQQLNLVIQNSNNTLLKAQNESIKLADQSLKLDESLKKKQIQKAYYISQTNQAERILSQSKSAIQLSQLALSELVNEQAALKAQLQGIRARRSQIQPRVNQLQTKVAYVQQQTKKRKSSMDQLQRQIKKRQEIGINLADSLLALQITIQTETTQITQIQRIKSSILLQLPQLKKNAQIQKTLNSIQFQQTSRLILKLKSIIKNIQSSIDVLHYQCNFVKSVTPLGNQLKHFILDLDITMDQTIISYEFSVSQYISYLRYLYGVQLEAYSTKAIKMKMTPISILDSVWTFAFGFPYTPDSFIGATNNTFIDDFQCLSTSELTTWVGTITKIQPKAIYIQDDKGKKWKLILSACSRIQAIMIRPRVGQVLLTRGVRKNDTTIQVYRSTCF